MRICRVTCHAQRAVACTCARVITFFLVFPWTVTNSAIPKLAKYAHFFPQNTIWKHLLKEFRNGVTSCYCSEIKQALVPMKHLQQGFRFTTSKMLCCKLAALLHHLQLPIITDVAFRPTVN